MLNISAAQMLAAWEESTRAAPPLRWLALLGGASGLDRNEIAALTIGQCDALLLDLREQLFGTRLECETRCPQCAERLEFAVATQSLRVAASEPRHEPQPLAIDGVRIAVRAVTVADVEACAGATTPEAAVQVLLTRCIEPVELADATLDTAHLEAIEQRMAGLDPQADLRIDLACPQCARGWSEPFDIGSFLTREMHAWAQRVLDEIHVIAAGYGWSESDILALSPARRRHYVERIAG
jgi:hypothetical protein